MKIKPYLPVVLAICSILIFLALIFKHERHLQYSQSIFVKLAPVDPRSMLQGDYMALNYELYLDRIAEDDQLSRVNNQDSFKILEEQIQDQAQIMSYVMLDSRQRVMHTSFDPQVLKDAPETTVKLLLKNPANQLNRLYPAANSFMFAEGLEPCYRHAKYAELKVNGKGQALLHSLTDQNLKPLHCEQQQKWSKAI